MIKGSFLRYYIEIKRIKRIFPKKLASYLDQYPNLRC